MCMYLVGNTCPIKLRCQKEHGHRTPHTGTRPEYFLRAVNITSVNSVPTLIVFNTIRIYGTVASSPRAVTERLLGSVWARYG